MDSVVKLSTALYDNVQSRMTSLGKEGRKAGKHYCMGPKLIRFFRLLFKYLFDPKVKVLLQSLESNFFD